MLNKYDISVIVPVYNAEKYISECLDSILAQNKSKIEIVVVNDGCTDGTPILLNKYRKKYNNVFVINKENGGLASARISGLNNSHGKYIGWVDADDFINPEMYNVLYKLAEENNADYVYCDYEFYPEKVATKEKWYKPYIGNRDWFFIERNTQCWNTLTLKSLIDSVGLVDLYKEFGEYSWISVMLNAEKIVSTDKMLYYYRVGNQTMSGGSYKGKVEHFIKGTKMTRELDRLLIGTGYEEKLEDYFQYRYIYTLLQLQIVAAYNGDRNTYINAKKELQRIKYKRNPYTKLILDTNYLRLKSFIIRNIIPSSFSVARLITNLVFK